MQVSIAGGKAHLHHAPTKGVELSTQVGRVCVIHLAREDLISNDEESRRQCYACKIQQSPRITLTSAKSSVLCQSHIVGMPTCCSDMLSLAASGAEAVIRPSDKPSMCGCTPLMKHWQDSTLPGSHLAAPAALGSCSCHCRHGLHERQQDAPVGAERLSSQTLFRPARSMRTSYSRCAGAYVPSSFLSALQDGRKALNKPSRASSLSLQRLLSCARQQPAGDSSKTTQPRLQQPVPVPARRRADAYCR